jgi:hypothetical protein
MLCCYCCGLVPATAHDLPVLPDRDASAAARAWTTHTISAPPEYSRTHWVSGRRASVSAMRVPTFTGGSIAAFAMNGSLYALLL